MDNTADPLALLRDIALPADPGWWPLAPGWWILAALLLGLIGLLAYLGWRWYQARAWQREAERELQQLRQQLAAGMAPDLVLQACSVLCRRVALAVGERTRVARLTDTAWLETLDRLSNSRDFTQGPGRLLGDRAWQRPDDTESLDLAPVLSALEHLIRRAAQQAPRRAI